MGGQACVLYGAAEFSRDCDIVIVADEANLQKLASALTELQAECIAIPEFHQSFLLRGHAVHFRCFHPDVMNLRLDVMTKLRGCDDFETLWQRRTTIEDVESRFNYELLSVEDLVKAKKTQCDKDWPMIRRLVEAHYDQYKDEPTPAMIEFWLKESRTPVMLLELVHRYRANLPIAQRPWLTSNIETERELQNELQLEEVAEKALDEAYWRPLKVELIELRVNRPRRGD